MTPGRAARGGGGASGLGALALALATAALPPGAGCGGRSDIDLVGEQSSDEGGRAGAGGPAGASGGEAGAPSAGAGGAAGGCVACGGPCAACVQTGAEASCGDERGACLATPGCVSLDACAREQGCLDKPDTFSAYACLNHCAALTAGTAQDIERWQAYTVCAACDPACAELCTAASPLCGLGGAGGGPAGAGGAGGAGGDGGAAGGGAGGAGGAGGTAAGGAAGGGAGGAAGSGGGGDCGACMTELGPQLCTADLAACFANSACFALDVCLRGSGCMSGPLDQFPLCALTSCAPFLFNPTALSLWNEYAQCALCSTPCYTTCLPWSAGLCLFDNDPGRGPLLAAPASPSPSCAGP